MTKVSLLPESASNALQEEVTRRLLNILGKGKAEKGEDAEVGEVTILTEYVWHLLDKEGEDRKSLLTKELQEFLEIHTDEFVSWLLDIIEKQANQFSGKSEANKGIHIRTQEREARNGGFHHHNCNNEPTSANHDLIPHLSSSHINLENTKASFRRSLSNSSAERDNDGKTKRQRSNSSRRHSASSKRHSGCGRHRHRSSKSNKRNSSQNTEDDSYNNSSRSHRCRDRSSHLHRSRRSLSRSDHMSGDKEKQRGRILGLAVVQATKTSHGYELSEDIVSQTNRNRSRSRSPILSRSIALSNDEAEATASNDVSLRNDENIRSVECTDNCKHHNGSTKMKAILKPNPRFTLSGNAVPLQQPLVLMYGPPASGIAGSISPVGAIPLQMPQKSGHSQGTTSAMSPLPVDIEIEVSKQGAPAPIEAGQNTLIADSSQGQIRKRCTRWPDCPFGTSCLYVHPTAKCKNWPNCPFGSSCFYWHPNVPCKYGSNCQNEFCNYSHISSGNPSSQPDFFGERTSIGLFKNKTWTSGADDDTDRAQEDSVSSLHDAITSLSTTLPGTPPELKKCKNSEASVPEGPQLPPSEDHTG